MSERMSKVNKDERASGARRDREEYTDVKRVII